MKYERREGRGKKSLPLEVCEFGKSNAKKKRIASFGEKVIYYLFLAPTLIAFLFYLYYQYGVYLFFHQMDST